jgi:hypothetical protein
LAEVERRPWPRDPRYLVGEDGSIIGPSGKMLSATRRKTGGYVSINHAMHGRQRVHVIVCETFHGPRPSGMQAAHTNDDPDDNRAANLGWKSPMDNIGDRELNGRTARGDRWGRKLDADTVRAVRAAAATGEPRVVTADRFGIAWQTVSRIVTRKTWRHVA